MIDKVRIGCYDYKIIYSDEPIILNNKVCSGAIDYVEKVIEIASDMDEQSQYVTLWHEIMHGALEYLGLQVDNEEAFVDSIAKVLYGMMIDNPVLPGQYSKLDFSDVPEVTT